MRLKNRIRESSTDWLSAPLRLTLDLTLFVTLSLSPVIVNAIAAQTGFLQGTISASGANGQPYNVPGATLKLIPSVPDLTPLSAVSNDLGEFKLSDLTPGSYTLEVSLGGFKKFITTVEEIRLELEVVKGEVTVGTDGEGLETTDAAPAAELNQNTLRTLPLVNERFQDALPLVPGVVRGPDGLLNVKGARASQSGLTVNSANVTDPVTGEFAINLPIEAIQSVQVLTNPYAPEYGKFTGAVTAIQTRSGSDKFDVQMQSPFPRLRRRGGAFAGIEAFTPRVTMSGPLIKDKLNFIQSFEYRFVRTPIENLPPLVIPNSKALIRCRNSIGKLTPATT